MALTLSVDQSDLSINSWLIRWGLMSGEYKDGKINTTKCGLINQLFAFWLFVYAIIKWTILLFSPKDSLTANLLGEWAYYFGPKIIFDLFIIILSVYVIVVKLLFVYASINTKKMFYWFEAMKFNPVDRSFEKLNLNESQSKKFVKRMSISFSF